MEKISEDTCTEEYVQMRYGKEERKEEKTGTKTDENVRKIKLFEKIKNEEPTAGRPYYLDYEKANILINDKWKNKVGGIPQGTFLLAFYEEDEEFTEALLLRVIKPTTLPDEGEIIGAIIDYYKDDKETTGAQSEIDVVTRSELSYSGLACRVLGTFYKENNELIFGSDVENFYSAYHYKVYKLKGEALNYVVNQNVRNFRIGTVRYSSSRRFQNKEEEIPVYIDPKDFLGKRTALFGMTRTGKSNTVKKIIQSTVEINEKYEKLVDEKSPIEKEGLDKPKLPAGQIIFDMNGEYANKNRQDEGTAIFELFEEEKVTRYSTITKDGFKVMKANFYKDIKTGLQYIKNYLKTRKDDSDYVISFMNVDLSEPEDEKDYSEKTRYDRRIAAYFCCLNAAKYEPPTDFKVYFKSSNEMDEAVFTNNIFDPSKGVSLDEATMWFTKVWEQYKTNSYFKEYKEKHGKEWADQDLKALLTMLAQKKENGGPYISGYVKLGGVLDLHTSSTEESFKDEIIKGLRAGKVIIVDLSEGKPEIQSLYSEEICKEIFENSMHRFISNIPNNFIQFYFEEAHNLFPKKDDKDLSQIYNRIAKEGAKLNLGIVYATQEVSSISSNILKNTQNWFISHLNNADEIREIEKYYDFSDFTNALKRFSPQDIGFVRMKVHSNPFVVPVQIDEFKVNSDGDVLED
jgi:DNA helicase HerA-like ATPase